VAVRRTQPSRIIPAEARLIASSRQNKAHCSSGLGLTVWAKRYPRFRAEARTTLMRSCSEAFRSLAPNRASILARASSVTGKRLTAGGIGAATAGLAAEEPSDAIIMAHQGNT
jgi:hypothetical protein